MSCTDGADALLLGLLGALEALTLRLPANAIRLGIFDARRMAGDSNTHRQAQLEPLLVGEAQLLCELVHPDLLGQVVFQSFS